MPRRLPQKTHARFRLDSMAQDPRSIPTGCLEDSRIWSWKRLLQVFTRPSSELAFTGLAFDPNHVSGDYDYSLLTVTEIVLQVILLLCSTGGVMFFTKKTRGTVTSKRPDFRLEISLHPEIELFQPITFCGPYNVLPGGSRLSHCSRCLAVFSLVIRSAPLDVHYASTVAAFSDCCHNGH